MSYDRPCLDFTFSHCKKSSDWSIETKKKKIKCFLQSIYSRTPAGHTVQLILLQTGSYACADVRVNKLNRTLFELPTYQVYLKKTNLRRRVLVLAYTVPFRSDHQEVPSIARAPNFKAKFLYAVN